jgi:hypothetical protein
MIDFKKTCFVYFFNTFQERQFLIDIVSFPESLPVAALAGGASSVVLVMILIITVIVCKR